MSLSSTSDTSLDDYRFDDWPKGQDGSDWDGKNLFGLLHDGDNPFKKTFNVRSLLDEVEQRVQAQPVDIPCVHSGSNNYVRRSEWFDILPLCFG